MRAKFERELARLGLPERVETGPPVTESDIDRLPDSAKRYLRFMRVIGRPRDWSFRASFSGLFRRRINAPWLKCEGWQYNSQPATARIFYLQIRFGGIVPVLGRDTYQDGHGRMHIKLFDLITVADGKGEEYDVSELVTYLNDCVFIAPSMLLVPEVTWSDVDQSSFDISLTNLSHTVAARVSIDSQGAPINFSTPDRFMADPIDPAKLTQLRWTTPVEGWREVGGRELWTRVRAIWHTSSGEFTYADFKLDADSVAFNIPPGH